jgi:hypothetical protein
VAFYHDRRPNDAGSLNSVFTVVMVVALFAFAVAATYLAG